MFDTTDLTLEMKRLHRFAMRLTKNHADADDLLQSTCLRALEKADYFTDNTNLFSWTSKIMYNLFVSGYRRKMKFESQYDPEPYLEKQAVPANQDLELEIFNTQKAIDRLSENSRRVITLVCLEGRKYQETAEILDIPIGTVRSRLCRARAQLRINMEVPSEKFHTLNSPYTPALMVLQK